MVNEFTTRQETCCFLSEPDLIAALDSESGVVKYDTSHTRACSDLCVRGSFFPCTRSTEKWVISRLSARHSGPRVGAEP